MPASYGLFAGARQGRLAAGADLLSTRATAPGGFPVALLLAAIATAGRASADVHNWRGRVGDGPTPVIEAFVSGLSAIAVTPAQTIASAVLALPTSGEGFFEITGEVASFLQRARAREGVLLLFLRHTSASLVIQENADPDVRADLVTALTRLAPADAGWAHQTEGADDMPAHVKSMLDGVCLHVPVSGGQLRLGTWQGIYVAEHRAAPHRREVVLQFVGSCAQG